VTDALIAVINTIAMVMIVPIGLSLAGPGPAPLARRWVGPAALAARRVLRYGLNDVRDVGIATTLVSPTVAASAGLGFAVRGLMARRRLSTQDNAIEEDRGAVTVRGGRRNRA
jgi:hypothetical protein